MRIIIQDSSGVGNIGLRGLQLWQNTYSSSAVITSNPINVSPGTYTLVTDDHSDTNLTNIVYQYSIDGVNYTTISAETPLSLPSQFWYRVMLTRSSQGFSAQSAAYFQTSGPPGSSSNYTVVSSSSVSLGSTVTERTIYMTNINTTPIVFNETPLANTLVIQNGSTILNSGNYTFTDNTLTMGTTYSALTLSYQVSSLSTTSISQLQNYYTPFINQITFEA
jgi:hypothetical protein